MSPIRGLWLATVALVWTAPAAAQELDGTIYMGTYSESIYVIDEATMEITDSIQMETGIPVDIVRSGDGERLYVRDTSMENVEIVDLASLEVESRFTLSRGSTKVRFRSMVVDPLERYVVLSAKSYTKARDRFEISPHLLLKVDLETQTVTDTIPWPDGYAREGVDLMFSPDGRFLYFFDDDIIALDAETFAEVGRWELSKPLQPGLGPLRFDFPTSPYGDQAIYTGLFRIDDPLNGQTMMGIATVDLAARDVDFYTLGPDEPVTFQLSPDAGRAYGILEEIGRYEFWTFDLVNREIVSRVPFEGRPRMALTPSTDGELLYIHQAGNTVDIYDADTYELLRTVEYDADMTEWLLVPGSASSGF